MTEFMKELNRIRDEKVPAEELEEQKRAVVAGFALTLESATDLLTYSITRKIYGLPDDYWETYPAKIMAVTADDVQRVARQTVNPRRSRSSSSATRRRSNICWKNSGLSSCSTLTASRRAPASKQVSDAGAPCQNPER